MIVSAQSGALVVLVAAQAFVPGLYLPPVLRTLAVISIHPRRSFRFRSTLLCGPYRASGRIDGASGCPTVCVGIISAAGIEIVGTGIRPRRSFRCQSKLPCELSGGGRVD